MHRVRRFLRGRMLPLVLAAALVAAGGVLLAIKLPRLLAPIAAAERALAFVLACLLVAIGEEEGLTAKLVLIAFLPYLGEGIVLYFWETARPAPIPEEGTDVLGRIAALTRRLTGISPCAMERADYFASGEAFGEAFLADLASAKTRIWLEYYILARGVFFDGILAVLEERARAGVDVRLIYDDFGCALTLPARFCRELEKRGIRARVYSRLRFGRGALRRDHRKLAVIDQTAYTGGINLADEYVGKRIRFGYWKDTAVRIRGDISPFSELFLRTWYALEGSKPPETAPERGEGNGQYLLVSDGPSPSRLAPALLSALFSSARESILLFTPYLTLPEALFSALTQAALRGVDVRILIPGIPDKKSVYLLTRGYADALARRGVGVRVLTEGFLHAKSALIDGKTALVSSYNLDYRSLYRQSECGVLTSDGALASALGRDFKNCWERGAPPKQLSRLQRALFRLLALFAPLT